MEKIYNKITEYLNTLLTDVCQNSIRQGVTKGNYILNNGDGSFCFRYPGATRGGFTVDEEGNIISFHVNYDRIINGHLLGCYIVNSEELERLLTEKFVGKNMDNLNYRDK